MADDKIRISWDEVKAPQVDDALQRQTAARTAQAQATPQLNNSSTTYTQMQVPLSAGNSLPKPHILLLLGGGLCVAMIVMTGVVFHLVRDSSVHEGSSHRKSSEVICIESVLQKDAKMNVGAKTVDEVVSRMRTIELTGCPNDFKSAYLAHIHAWEAMVEVEQQAITFKAESESGGVFVESLIRGFLGDPFGKANEIRASQNQLQRNYQSARQQVRDSFHRVEEIAIAHGADLPENKRER